MSNNTEQININNNKNDGLNTMTDTLFFINDTYDQLSYFDLYGNSVIIGKTGAEIAGLPGLAL